MSTPTQGWTTIRIREETAEWLRRESAHLAELAARNMIEVDEVTDRYGRQQGTGISVDQVIRRLVKQALRHRARGRRRRGHANTRPHNAVVWAGVVTNV